MTSKMWTISLGLVAILLSLWILWRKKQFNTFKALNIPGPPPSFFFGNLLEIYRKGQHECIKEWIEKYGRVLGYYYGLRPVILIADPELLKTIQLKDFHKFPNRPSLFAVSTSARDTTLYALTSLKDKRWKDVRSIITPTFTTSKLKLMSPIINEAVDELVEAVEQKANTKKPFNIFTLYQNLTMDVIARTALGVHSRAQKGVNEPFLRVARILFSVEISLLIVLSFSFLEFKSFFGLVRRLLLSYKNEGKNPRMELRERTSEVIAVRRKDPTKRRPDLLQMMMDAKRSDENVNVNELTAGESEEKVSNGAATESGKKMSLALTDEEISQNASLFLLAGYETTSTALVFTTHLLAHHPEVQESVRNEVNEHLQDTELTYESIQKLQYLEKVLMESLRLFPPITYFVNREPVEEVMYNNVRIPKNISIQVPVYYLHHDPTLWNDPETFDPERFSREEKLKTHAMAFQPFGAGPRNCVGMRFALMEAKMALARLLQKYKITPAPGAREDNLNISKTVFSMRPKNGLLIQVEKCS